MNKKQLYDFADECVVQLGELVGRTRKRGLDIGLTEKQTRKVWLTVFDVLVKKQRMSRRLISSNLKQKAPPPESA